MSTYDTDVREITREHPSDEVPRLIILGVLGDFEGLALSREENLQVRHPSVVNIAVRGAEAPDPLRGVEGKMTSHVLVYLNLEIDAQSPVGSDDHIGTDPYVSGDITPGIGDGVVTAIVCNLVLSTLLCGLCDGTTLEFSQGILRQDWCRDEDNPSEDD